MKRFDSILLKIYLYGLPVFIFFIIRPYFPNSNLFFNCLSILAVISFVTWFILTFYLCVRLMISHAFREMVLTKLTFIRERDERESLLTGQATRTTFLISLAILIFFFYLSCIHISLNKGFFEMFDDSKTTRAMISLHLNLLEQPDKFTMGKDNMVSHTALHFSSSTVILILIAWQIISYNFSIRRLIKKK